MTQVTYPSQKIPKLRFREFHGGWEEKKLREYTNLITKGTTPKSFGNGNVNYVKIECLEKNKIIKNRCSLIEGEVHKKELKRSILSEGDILFAIAGATIGKCGIVTSDILPANTNQALAIIRLNKESNGDYIFHILKSEIMKKYIKDNLTAGAQPNLNLEQMGSFSFYSPSLPEQQKIASFLSSVDTNIEQLREKKSLLEEYKKGVMQKIFAREIRFRDENGEEYEEWEEKKLGEIAKFSKGKLLSKSDLSDEGKNECIHYGELFTTYSETIKEIKSKTNLEDKMNFSELNDILMPTSDVTPNGLATASALSKAGVILGGDILIIRSKTLLNSFFCYYVKNHRRDIMRLVSGSTVYHLSGSEMATLKIHLPTLPEQQKIASFLSEIDTKIENTSEQLEQAEKWKKGLLQGMFV